MTSGEDWNENTAAEAERAVGYTFRDKQLLVTCFTHKSYTNYRGQENNERLEFLGDAVLELCVTESLYLGRSEDEGRLTELRKQYVSKAALERAERKAGLMRFLRYSGGESNVSGKTSSNLFEAVVAGIYLDGGMKPVRKFLKRYLVEIETDNYKTLLQELVQEREKKTPCYRVFQTEDGYRCEATALGKSAAGEGESKKSAEVSAAKALYQILSERTES